MRVDSSALADTLRGMSIQHALLTSLLEQPSTGYALATRFDRSMGYFWQATHQQIYRELGRMAQAGWIAALDTGAAGRRKKTYQVLESGRLELLRWVEQPLPAGLSSEALLVKLRAAAVVGTQGLKAQVLALIAQRQARLEAYLAIEQRDFTDSAQTVAQQLRHQVLRRGIMLEESWLQWAHGVLPLLQD